MHLISHQNLMCSTSTQHFHVKTVEVWETENSGWDVRPQTNSTQVGLFLPLTEGGQVHAGHLMLHCACAVKTNTCNVAKLPREAYYVIIKILLIFISFINLIINKVKKNIKHKMPTNIRNDLKSKRFGIHIFTWLAWCPLVTAPGSTARYPHRRPPGRCYCWPNWCSYPQGASIPSGVSGYHS